MSEVRVPGAWRAPLALFLLALALRLVGIHWGLPEVYEEAYPFKRAWEMWGWGPRPPDFDPHFFKYPSLTIYLQFAGQGALYVLLAIAGRVRSALDYRTLFALDPTAFYVTGRTITALLGAATVLPVMGLARRAAGASAALIAGLLVAVSAPLIAKSQVIEVDVPLACLAAWALLRADVLAERPTRRNALLAGVAMGLATSAKYPGVLLALPMLAALALRTRASEMPRPAGGVAPAPAPERRPSRSRDRRRDAAAPRSAGGPGRATARDPGFVRGALFVGLAFGVTLLATSPFLVLDFGGFWRDIHIEGEHMREGHFGITRGLALAEYARAWFASVAGWPLGVASLSGLALFVARRQRWALLVAAFFVPYLAVVGSWQMKADRYLLPLLPPATIFAGALVAAIAAWAAGRLPRPAARATVPALALILALPAVLAFPSHLAALGPDTRTQARAWIESHVAPGSLLAIEQYGPHVVNPIELETLDAEVRAALQARGWPPRLYAVQTIPMFQVEAERSARFYDFALYAPMDFVIVTGSVRDRYREDPARFAPQLAFYDSLERRFTREAQFAPRGAAGPDIVIYRNPSHAQPFARRPESLPRRPLFDPAAARTGGEAFFCFNLGVNYDQYGFIGPAAGAYREALAYAEGEPQTWLNASLRFARCLARANRPGDAVSFLEEAAARAPGAREAGLLRATAARMRAGGAVPGR